MCTGYMKIIVTDFRWKDEKKKTQVFISGTPKTGLPDEKNGNSKCPFVKSFLLQFK